MSTTLATRQSGSPPLDERSRYLRRLAVRCLDKGERGHIGSTMSLIEILRVLYDDVLRYRPNEPAWRERDRMILSKEMCIRDRTGCIPRRWLAWRAKPPRTIPERTACSGAPAGARYWGVST